MADIVLSDPDLKSVVCDHSSGCMCEQVARVIGCVSGAPCVAGHTDAFCRSAAG